MKGIEVIDIDIEIEKASKIKIKMNKIVFIEEIDMTMKINTLEIIVALENIKNIIVIIIVTDLIEGIKMDYKKFLFLKSTNKFMGIYLKKC